MSPKNMKQFIVIAIIGLVLQPLGVLAALPQPQYQYAQQNKPSVEYNQDYTLPDEQEKEDIKNDAQQNAEDAKKDAANSIEENLGTYTTPEQQKNAILKILSGLEKVLFQAKQEVQGSPNLTIEQKQEILAVFAKMEGNMQECEENVNNSDTQEELNVAYAKCVENIKATINTIMNEVYDVMLEAMAVYLEYVEVFFREANKGIAVFNACDAIDTESVEIYAQLVVDGEKLQTEVTALYEKMLTLDYNRANVVKASELMARLTATMGKIYEDYEDLYAMNNSSESCDNYVNESVEEIEALKQELIKSALPTKPAL